jgi:isoleucyl-tRNA synthetase
LGGKVQELIKLAKEGEFEMVESDMDVEIVKDIEKKEGIKLSIPGSIKIGGEILSGDEVIVGFQGKDGEAIESDGGIVVALDTKITDDLKLEGRARDLVRAIQDLRKKADYDVSDRIELQLEGAEEILKVHEKYITAETLAEKVTSKLDTPDAEDSLGEIKIGVKKV